jgi:serine/threonine-protein kinase
LSDKNSGDQVTVPAVVDLPRDQATKDLTNAGFKVAVEQDVDPDKDENTVLSQDPSSGTKADKGSTVRIVVNSSQPKVEVPSLVGKQRADAEALLREAGLVADVTPKASDQPEGQVIAQDPEAGQELPRSSVVKLTVSSGPESETVPDVSLLLPDAAAERLQRSGFGSEFQEEPSDDVPRGKVTRTDPPADSQAPRGSTVTIYVSSGPETSTSSTSSSSSSTSSSSTSSTTTTTFP